MAKKPVKSKAYIEKALQLLKRGIPHEVTIEKPALKPAKKPIDGKPVQSKATIKKALKLRRGGIPPDIISKYCVEAPEQPETIILTEYNTLRKDIAKECGVPLQELSAELEKLDRAVARVRDGAKVHEAAEKECVAPKDILLAMDAAGFTLPQVPHLAHGDKHNQGIAHAPVYRWQRGTEPEEASIEKNGRRIQRLFSGLLQLRKSGAITDAEVAAAIRWRSDYELAVEGARDPEVSGTGSGDPGAFMAATVDITTKYRQACQAVGARGDQLLRAYVAQGLSIIEMSRRISGDGLPSRSWQYRISKELSETLFKLSTHYYNVDIVSKNGLLPRRLTDAQIAARKAASAAYKIVPARKST